MNSIPLGPSFPTAAHEEAAECTKAYFLANSKVDSVLVVNSCARGQAVADSDLDFAILVAPGTTSLEIQEFDRDWQLYAQTSPAILAYRAMGRYAHLHLDLISGDYHPGEMEDGGMPDFFEIEIGNQVCHSAPMGKAGPFFGMLREKWLPYYAEDLRTARLQMVRESCEYDLSRIPSYVERGLYFQAFDRLTVAFQKYLQALFISKRTYPIAYNKWIRLQVETWLNLPELYPSLAPILSLSNIEGSETTEKAVALGDLLNSLFKIK